MSLMDNLKAQAERSTAAATPEVNAGRRAAIAAVADVASGAVTVGDHAPDFTLPDATGAAVHLADLLAAGPVVVSFYRGGWCPYCNLELHALQVALPDLTAAGGTLVAISPEAPDASLTTSEKQNLEFPVLSDTDAATITAYRLNFTIDSTTRAVLSEPEAEAARAQGVATEILPVPATYVIGTDGTVTFAFVDPSHTHRAEPADVVAAVAALTGGAS
ncbi:peroxiredoxin-like family protein [Sanguibacter antarcticus]|uniref:thioredoxin-dependent peroxiredoxin n=1 Tax=Sanguibacter antarcticus TaxID=372484 RepID=A0A2A9E649_9MICO|nr:peroxiredoxin-like family protein [Sanguibacter antarcticus]PFG34438.1 peroxiredoxin [Sanguibacter antarcticus]